MNVASHTRAVDYETALIWRCNDITIVGDSGSMLVRMQHERDGAYTVHGVGFQSHELPISVIPMNTKPQSHWKIAFRPPLKLIAEYWALAPSDMIDVLEKGARGRGYFSSSCHKSCRKMPNSIDTATLAEIVDDFVTHDRQQNVASG